MIVLFDGPNKVGKTTFIEHLDDALRERGAKVKYRKWGPVDPDDRVYGQPLSNDCQFNGIVIWDRGWPSEHVYGTMLKRNRRLVSDPWLGEWLFGRALDSVGQKFILLPPEVSQIRALQDETDHKYITDPAEECLLWEQYAERFGYTKMFIDKSHGEEETILRAHDMAHGLMQHKEPRVAPPFVAGNLESKVVVVSEPEWHEHPGAILPMSGLKGTEFGRMFGQNAGKILWVNSHGCPPAFIRDGREIYITCGDIAAKWLRMHVAPTGNPKIISLKSPAYALAGQRTAAANQLKNTAYEINDFLGGSTK